LKKNQENNKNIVIKRTKTKNKLKTNAIKLKGTKLQKQKIIIKRSIKHKNKAIKSRVIKLDKKILN